MGLAWRFFIHEQQQQYQQRLYIIAVALDSLRPIIPPSGVTTAIVGVRSLLSAEVFSTLGQQHC